LIVALVLLSAFLHAGWNALLRVEPDKDRGLVAAIAIASAFACVIAGVRWALGEQPFATTESLLYTLLAGAFEAVYFMTLARALELGRLGAVYTVSRGGAVLVVWPLSIVLFAETATLTSTAGSIVVLLGLVLSSLGSTSGGNRDHRAGIAWAAACAVSIAGYHLSYKASLLAGGNPSAVFAVSLSLSALISIVRIGREGRRILATVVRARIGRVALMGIICGGSFLILMEALARGGSGYVLTLRNTSVLFAALLALTIGERPRHAELVGALFVAAGAVLMSLP
jgi:drug/metabolite transporter (DMT)-like permease